MSLQIITGDCRLELKKLAEKSVQCCVTSPPYWGLRDYGHSDQIGLEQNPQAYVETMRRQVFSEVWRVLKDDGTLWLNLGDSYASNPAKGGSGPNGKNGYGEGYARALRRGSARADGIVTGKSPRNRDGAPRCHLPAKNLIGIPWRVAFALQEDGWYLRSDIIWHKPNPMPESVTDRPTKSHEYIFLLTKREKYYYDAGAIAEPMTTEDYRRPYGSPGANALDPRGHQGNGELRRYAGKATKDFEKGNAQDASATKARIVDHIIAGEITSRNKRSVWTVTTKPYSEVHFATFPPDLIKPCILAGTKPGDVVIDPFGGSGTTGMVALELGRSAILIELNPDYTKLCDERCNVTAGLPLE